MPRVLLIDDTPEIAELLTYALRERGHDVICRGFVIDINELAAEQHVDAVVLDCSVLSNSEQLFDELRSELPHMKTPVVLISDTPEAADRSLRSRHAQLAYVIPKPFTGSQVARAIDELMLERVFPIGDLVPRWRFRLREQSPGVYVADGRDADGRSVSNAGADEDEVLARCAESARGIDTAR